MLDTGVLSADEVHSTLSFSKPDPGALFLGVVTTDAGSDVVCTQ